MTNKLLGLRTCYSFSECCVPRALPKQTEWRSPTTFQTGRYMNEYPTTIQGFPCIPPPGTTFDKNSLVPGKILMVGCSSVGITSF